MTDTIPLLGGSPDQAERACKRHGIRADIGELAAVAARLGRDLTVTEAFLIDVAYSEHCSYKSSRRFLRDLLPPLAPHVILGPGEDAGVIDIGEWNGERYALVVAHESHNHPSQLLPVEGAATGIGGIVRDVYCMGADVIGVLDGLRFGDLSGPNSDVTRGVARGVVRGIWEYGNALGVPNLGGDVAFDSCYDENCLVNVVALGIAPVRRILRSRVPARALEEPYEVVLVGKPTDRSGIGGASFASQVLDDRDAEQNLGAVQIHDPFLKRVVVEATKAVWDLIERVGCEVGFKDLGAGGFGGASSELLVAGGFGGEIHLDQMPAAEPSMRPEHLLIGETQERFVWALPSSIVPEVLAIYNEAFDLPGIYPGARAASVGRVIAEPRYRVLWKGDVIVDLPFETLKDTPVLERPVRPRSITLNAQLPPAPEDWGAFLQRLLSHPDLCSRAHIYRHYDGEVRGEALLRPGEADAGVCRPIAGAHLGVAVSLDGNADWCDLDPYHGAMATVVESVRNVVSVGASPRALTDCMNFGSPEDPECLWEFEQALRGMAEACIGLGLPENRSQAIPIVSGNVSLYNQSSAGRKIKPTPIVACFGTLRDWRRRIHPWLAHEGAPVYLVGTLRSELGGSPALEILGGTGLPPRPDPRQAGTESYALLECMDRGWVTACHDIASGGLVTAAFECAVREEGPTGFGLELLLDGLGLTPLEALLSESGGFLVEVDPSSESAFHSHMANRGSRTRRIGRTLGEPVIRALEHPESVVFEVQVGPLWDAWTTRLGPWMEGGAS